MLDFYLFPGPVIGVGYLFVSLLTGLPDLVEFWPCENLEIIFCELFAFPFGPNLGMTSTLQKSLFFLGVI